MLFAVDLSEKFALFQAQSSDTKHREAGPGVQTSVLHLSCRERTSCFTAIELFVSLERIRVLPVPSRALELEQGLPRSAVQQK